MKLYYIRAYRLRGEIGKKYNDLDPIVGETPWPGLPQSPSSNPRTSLIEREEKRLPNLIWWADPVKNIFLTKYL